MGWTQGGRDRPNKDGKKVRKSQFWAGEDECEKMQNVEYSSMQLRKVGQGVMRGEEKPASRHKPKPKERPTMQQHDEVVGIKPEKRVNQETVISKRGNKIQRVSGVEGRKKKRKGRLIGAPPTYASCQGRGWGQALKLITTPKRQKKAKRQLGSNTDKAPLNQKKIKKHHKKINTRNQKILRKKRGEGKETRAMTKGQRQPKGQSHGVN